ncbi:MAG: hypothetical protein KGJ86_10255 [Chloroflexota bacterium]|nr:hypothetical protein [Chloroflexota bacterium]
MNRTEHLLTVLAEECVEVAKEVSKALRFGLDDTAPLPPNSGAVRNRLRIAEELGDVLAMVNWLVDENIIPQPVPNPLKRPRVKHFMQHARTTGALEALV